MDWRISSIVRIRQLLCSPLSDFHRVRMHFEVSGVSALSHFKCQPHRPLKISWACRKFFPMDLLFSGKENLSLVPQDLVKVGHPGPCGTSVERLMWALTLFTKFHVKRWSFSIFPSNASLLERKKFPLQTAGLKERLPCYIQGHSKEHSVACFQALCTHY